MNGENLRNSDLQTGTCKYLTLHNFYFFPYHYFRIFPISSAPPPFVYLARVYVPYRTFACSLLSIHFGTILITVLSTQHVSHLSSELCSSFPLLRRCWGTRIYLHLHNLSHRCSQRKDMFYMHRCGLEVMRPKARRAISVSECGNPFMQICGYESGNGRILQEVENKLFTQFAAAKQSKCPGITSVFLFSDSLTWYQDFR